MGRRQFAAMVALCLLCMASVALAGPIGYSVASNYDDHLYSIDLATGVATDLGLVSFGDAEGLEFVGTTLYAIGGSTDELWDITTAPGSKVGDTGDRIGVDAGLGYDATTGTLYNVNGDGSGSGLYQVNAAAGTASLVGSSSTYLDGLAITPGGVAYAADFVFSDSLYTVNLSTGTPTLVGSLAIGAVNARTGLGYDAASSTLYALTDGSAIYTLNTSTGAATLVSNVTYQGQTIAGFEGLAIPGADVIPEPTTVALLAGGLLALVRRRRRS